MVQSIERHVGRPEIWYGPERSRLHAQETQKGVQGGDHMDLAYDDLIKLPYLDAVCRETLRVYAPVTLSTRTCVLSHPHAILVCLC